ncbi:MAG TPA: hypothetical protein VJU15_08710, partial [Gemmatimonadales bacterium]|nr:hypothetical protein [Gemmatimonadales bacterium]
MRHALLLALYSSCSLLPGQSRPDERAVINDNRQPAGVLKNGVLTLELEARVTRWYPHTDDGPSTEVQGFGEVGHSTQIPGPLIRVPAGTVIDLSLRNAVPNTTLMVHGLSADSISVAETEKRHVRFTLSTPGTYYYWGTTT